MIASSLRDHAEIAMIGLGRMHEEGRRSGGRQRRRDLGADMAAFADAGHDDAARDPGNQFDRMGERLGKPVLQGGSQSGDARLLGGDGPQRRSDRRLAVRWFLERSRKHGRCD